MDLIHSTVLQICNYSIFSLIFLLIYVWLLRKVRRREKIASLGSVWHLCICYFALF